MKIASFFKKVPAGNILIPMFLSALIHTINPNLFRIGGTTQALLAGEGLNFLIGVACFCSGLLLDFKTLKEVLAKQGALIVVKVLLASAGCFIFFQLFKAPGIFGISILALVSALFSSNPAMYLSIMDEKGTQKDVAAFGLVGLLSLPVIPMLFFGFISTQANIDLAPVVSTLIPILLGMALGNIDPKVREYFSPLLSRMMPLLGWALGVSINLLDAFKSGLSGLLLAVLFYCILTFAMYFVETKVLKHNGASALALSSSPGLSISYPAMLAAIHPELAPFVPTAAAQLAFVVVLTNILTPILANKLVPDLDEQA